MDIQGLDELLKTFQNSSENFNDEAQKVVNQVGNSLLRKVKLKTPVGKVNGGTLRRSWQGKKGDLSFTVSNNVHYAPHVEYGHRVGKTNKVVDGRYMLTKSVEEIDKEFEGYLDTLIENLWK